MTGPAIQALLVLESPLELELELELLLELEVPDVDDGEGVDEGMLDPASSANEAFARSLTVLVVFFR